MSVKSRQLGQTKAICLISTLTLSGSPVVPGACAPVGQTVALIQNQKLSDWVSTNEVWRPMGINLSVSTTLTTTAPTFTLNKAPLHATASTYAAASSGGVATSGLLTAGSARYYPFTTYSAAATVAPSTTLQLATTNFTADAAGDVWTVAVSTAPAAGAAAISLHYVCVNAIGISDAVTTL